MDIKKLQAELDALLADASLFEEANLQARNEAIVYIKYFEDVMGMPGYTAEFDPRVQYAVELGVQLKAINKSLFQEVRTDLQNGNFTPECLRTFFDKFTGYVPGRTNQPEYEYDGLDMLLEQVLFPEPPPSESRKRASGMIRYEATPARVILEMIDNIKFLPEDVFVDIGSGLGLIVMLVNLLTGVKSLGIEFDPAYCEYAQNCAANLNLQDVSFLQSDARKADLNAGSIFYLFTPFVNEIFESVLERLRYTAIRKPIYICSYGTITYDLIKLPWLQIRDPAMMHDFKLAIFTSK